MLFSSNAFFLFYYITSVKKNPKSHSSVPACFCAHYIVVFWLCKLKVFLSGDIETNLGPAQKNQNKLFSICHWNLNGITAHGYFRVSLLKAYITAHKMNITCLSENCLESSIQTAGYDLLCSDHPWNIKRGGEFCIYCKAWLPFKVINVCRHNFWSVDLEKRFVGNRLLKGNSGDWDDSNKLQVINIVFLYNCHYYNYQKTDIYDAKGQRCFVVYANVTTFIIRLMIRTN